MQRQDMSEASYDEACRIIGDVVLVLKDAGAETGRTSILAILRKALMQRNDLAGEDNKALKHALMLMK
ncbi:hypothetical protein BTJ39_08915 [Izhakiella australiensis]|uniref:Fumarase D n=1 Tax=Izhakiella australiensis TaxID=1926881 RepID=A0A1S8YP22_9GAMM|nr:DUF2767 family protein [Izhakiella australiensis]OON40516.1 hypothetical protein BTJ39_08915 [Izhakiella australiensis]